MKTKETVLVTGGTGFVGRQLIFQLLQKGYQVKTTIRNLTNKESLISSLKANGIESLEDLSFAQAELTKDDHWEQIMNGCKYVLSVASPVFFDVPQNEQEAIRPSVEGILRVLKFAKKADVKRVVMTSNFGAVGFSHTDTTTQTNEEDWTDIRLKGLSVYEKSKTLAERAAWDFIAREGESLEFVTINPVAILGPSLDAHFSGSFHLLENLLNGSMKVVPNIPLNVVDVRDVADLHIRAMTHPMAKGHRFIASADGQISIQEIATLLKKHLPEVSQKVSSKKLPDWILSFASLFNAKAKEGVMLRNVNRNISNQKAKTLLGWTPIATQEQTILAAVESMVQYSKLP